MMMLASLRCSMEIVMLSLDAIHPDPDNPRVNSGGVEKVAASIREFGFRVPIVLNREHKILAGHTRYAAAALLKLTELPCIVVDSLTPEQERAFNIADNRTSEFSFWDTAKLAELVTDLPAEMLDPFDVDALLYDSVGGDDDGKGGSGGGTKPEKRQGLDLAPFEKYQYVTVICRSTYDYTNLLERLGLEDVQFRYLNGLIKRGSSYGRVIEFADLMRLLDS